MTSALNERAVAAAKLANLKHGDVASQKHDAPIGASIITRDEAAKKLGVGKGTLDCERGQERVEVEIVGQ
jgi:hypothetical protein